MGTVDEPIDVIKELRLRRWARSHYVPAEQRGNTWHPIVLDEMRRRDAELRSQEVEAEHAEQAGIYAYVPLIPDHMRKLHQGHNGIADPQFLHHAVEIDESIELFVDLR